jgi:hypothetical protein
MAPNRWFILAVLFAVRVMMAFQFQSVAAMTPPLSSKFGVGPTDIAALRDITNNLSCCAEMRAYKPREPRS